MAFQVAYYKQNKLFHSTYESASTKTFLHGRTEVVRSTTPDAVNLAKTWVRKDASDAEKEAALRKAVDTHVALMNLCKNGQGVDRHLLGLYHLSRFNEQSLPGYQMPLLFSDKAYTAMTTSVLSTSNCGTSQLTLFGFGPVVQNGYGIAYFIRDKNIPINVTSFERPTAEFVGLIKQTLTEFVALLEKNKKIR